MKKLFRALSLCLTLALCVFCSTAALAEAPAATPAPQDERVITDVSPLEDQIRNIVGFTTSTGGPYDFEQADHKSAVQAYGAEPAEGAVALLRIYARAEDRPGVTRSKQWVPVDSTLELLDTPGILWPRFDDPEVGKRLAFTGAIKDDVVDMEELACCLMDYLSRRYAPVLAERYKIEVEPEDSGYDLLEKAGRKRGFLMRGAQVDTQRMARVLLDEFRGGKLGRFTLETVEDAQ